MDRVGNRARVGNDMRVTDHRLDSNLLKGKPNEMLSTPLSYLRPIIDNFISE